MSDAGNLITIKRACEILGISRDTFDYWKRRGKLADAIASRPIGYRSVKRDVIETWNRDGSPLGRKKVS